MDNDILEAINQNEDEIRELKSQIELMKSLDTNRAIDENTWHKICETPLRTSNLLATFVKNTFPASENILVRCNYVYFNLYGFEVQIPTSYSRGININTNWYQRDCGLPKIQYTSAEKRLIRYFEALDSKEGWKTLARLRCDYKEWFLPFAWFFKYKWVKVNRNLLEEMNKSKNEKLVNQTERYRKVRTDMHNKALFLQETVLPILDKFSSKHRCWNGSAYGTTIEEIMQLEKIV